MKTQLLGLMIVTCLLAASCCAEDAIRLYEGPAPGSEEWTHSEQEYFSPIFKTEVVTNVVNPTLTPFLPDPAKATGAGVIIAPGGGFHALSINSEGTDVAKWLNERGIAGFVLRYRLIPTGKDGVQEMLMKASNRERIQKDMADAAPLAGADGLEAVRYVRKNAEKYNLRSHWFHGIFGRRSRYGLRDTQRRFKHSTRFHRADLCWLGRVEGVRGTSECAADVHCRSNR